MSVENAMHQTASRLVSVSLADTPVESVFPAPAEQTLRWKALADFVLAVFLILATAPIIAIAVVLVKLTSAGPAFYSQTRVGRRGRPFLIHKLRSMFHDCENKSGPKWSTHGDPRVTIIGRILRKTHIDELPQLWNVLCGEMSLVGPRPERPEFVPQLDRLIPYYRDRLLVRPGLTGLAQVQLPPDTHLASVRKKLAYDLFYVRHLSPWLDCQLLLATAFHVLHVPFAIARCLFRVPSGQRVEMLYETLMAGASKSAASAPPAALEPLSSPRSEAVCVCQVATPSPLPLSPGAGERGRGEGVAAPLQPMEAMQTDLNKPSMNGTGLNGHPAENGTNASVLDRLCGTPAVNEAGA